MGMIVQHNMNALNAYNKLNANVAGLKKASEKLSSGYRINRAGDDAAGLAISEKMRSQIRGLNQAVRNSQDGINMIQTFEGAAQETHSILQRMKELASESANGTYDNATDRAALQLEFDQLNDELNQIADTDFNGTIVLNGGVMADGLEAEGDEFNYANFDAQQKAKLAKAPVDMVAKGDYTKDKKAPELQDGVYVEGSATDKTAAGAAKLWDQAKTDGYAAAAKQNSIRVKYSVSKVDENGKVTEYKGEYVDASGNKIADYTGDITPTDNGGFTDTVTGAVVVLDTIGSKVGDFVTVEYTKPEGAEQAPTNIGIVDSYIEGKGVTVNSTNETWKSTVESAMRKTTVTLAGAVGTNWTDATKKAGVQKAITELDGAEITLEFTNTATKGNAVAAPTADNCQLKIGEKTYSFTELATNNGNKKGWGIKAAATATTFTLTYDGEDIATVTYDVKTDGTGTETATATIKVTVDGYRTASDEKPNAKLVNDPTTVVDDSVSQSNAFKHSTARLTYADDITLQTGARSKDAVNFTFNYNTDGSADMGTLINNLDISSREKGLGTAGLSLADQDSANDAIDKIDKAINKVSMVRATFGAIQNRLEHKITNLTTTSENLQEAESAIRDTDMASEMMNYTKFNILQQAAQSMLAQANQQPQSILQLLG